MIIAPQRVVTLHYELSDEQGQVLDDSRARGRPLEYLHGHANIMAGLERALEGREVGAELSVTLQPAEAYGQRDEALVQRLSRSAFPGEALSPGMRFQTRGRMGLRSSLSSRCTRRACWPIPIIPWRDTP